MEPRTEFNVVLLHHSPQLYDLPPDKAWQGGVGVWRARRERLATQDFAVFHDGESMWDAVTVLDAVEVPLRHQARGQEDPARSSSYAQGPGAPRCVLVADPRLPAWLEGLLGTPPPLPPARTVVRYAVCRVQGNEATWSRA